MFLCCCDPPKNRRVTEEIEAASTTDSDEESDSQEWSYADHEWDSMYFGGICCPREPSANLPAKSLSRSKTMRMSPSFGSEYGMMPAARRGDPQHLVIDQVALPELSLDHVQEVIEQAEVLEGYLREFSQASDVKLTGWFDAPGGLRACRAKFTMPVPQEVPAALARLISVPEASAATMVLAHTSSGDAEELVMLQQVTHDVPFGENFRVQETMSFRRDTSGSGVTVNKWTTIKWIKDLPWHVSMIKPITESKIMSQAPEGGQAFLRVLQGLA